MGRRESLRGSPCDGRGPTSLPLDRAIPDRSTSATGTGARERLNFGVRIFEGVDQRAPALRSVGCGGAGRAPIGRYRRSVVGAVALPRVPGRVVPRCAATAGRKGRSEAGRRGDRQGVAYHPAADPAVPGINRKPSHGVPGAVAHATAERIVKLRTAPIAPWTGAVTHGPPPGRRPVRRPGEAPIGASPPAPVATRGDADPTIIARISAHLVDLDALDRVGDVFDASRQA